ncbi:MAG: aminopeptidase [Bacteroidia bacterium]|nr:MAG: aminopeptidase [Bacteroidia bacterium]
MLYFFKLVSKPIQSTLVFVVFLSRIILAQDKSYLLQVCTVLCSKEYSGRGYTAYPSQKITGIEKAKEFIIQEIKKNGGYDLREYITKTKQFSRSVSIKSLKNKFSYKNEILFPFNNIHQVYVEINNQKLILGQDYLPDASSPNIDFVGQLIKIDSIHFINKEHKIILKISEKLIYSASQQQEDFVLIHIKKDLLKKENSIIDCKIKIKAQIEKVKTNNIYTFIPGTQFPDSFIVFSAHYDHLGNIDTTIFPGANDNVSGVAVLLDLMRYYKRNPLKYSIAFYFFTGEEIGLLGSKYYVDNPLFDLKRIKFLINLDLMGGGSEGIMVINGKVFENEFEKLVNINNEKYHLVVKSRGKAQNSDHYWFTEKGVKSFFIYTLGDIKAYHDIYDIPKNLTFWNYEKIFSLLVDWINSIN